MIVKLNDVLEALYFVNDETQYYYNIKTEQVIMLMDGMMTKKMLQLRDHIIDEYYEDYIVLPGKYEINEYTMMENFIDELNDVDKQDKLYSAIRSKGAFRKFKDRLFDLGLEKIGISFVMMLI